MIGDIIVLDTDLKIIGYISLYKSVIWAKRYIEIGDCEVYIPATTGNFELIKQGKYLARSDDDMVCQIKKIELDTSVEDGDYLIITGVDAKCILSQRIIWDTYLGSEQLDSIIIELITRNLTLAEETKRRINKSDETALVLTASTLTDTTTTTTTQISYKNIQEMLNEICIKNGWGYKFFILNFGANNAVFRCELYQGTDLSASVIFSEKFDNLNSSKYVEDATNLGNVALVAGEGQGADRKKVTVGTYSGGERFEVFVDAREISSTIKYSELLELYPGGTIQSTELDYYELNSIKIPIIDDNQLAMWEYLYSGSVVIENGQRFFESSSFPVMVALLNSSTPDSDDDVELMPAFYNNLLYQKGADALTEYGKITSFDAEINPYSTFKYKSDWNLGDIVKIENSYGVSVNARITEIIEAQDENGYSVQPKYEYITEV